MYVTTADVYGATSLTTTQVTDANVTNFILAAEKDINFYCIKNKLTQNLSLYVAIFYIS